MLRLLLAAFLLVPTLAFAQSQRNPCYINSKGGCTPVGTSGAPNGAQPMPVTASVSASISGFNQESVLTPITATTGGATSSAFTAGKVIVVSNVGSTNTAYCRLGGSSTTSGQPILPGSWFAFTSVLETTVTCATSTSTTTVNVSVGTGLPTGAGGGSSSGGGGGGAVTIADGADATQGAIADAAATAGGTGTLSAKTRLITTQLGTLTTNLGSPFQAGGSIGNTSFGISGTLPAFGATPTFNLGTLNGAATAANQTNASQKSQIVDGSGNVIGATANALDVNIKSGGGSGGTSSNFGATFPTAGTASGMSQGGNMVALTGTSGNLNVQCANCSGSGASGTDQGTFTAGSSVFAPSGGVFQTSATSNPLTNGQWGTWQLTANRAGFVNLRNTAGAEIATSGIPLRVDPTGTTTQPVSGAVTASSATTPVSTMNSASANTGLNAANAAVFDDVTPTSITENNFGFLRMSANRNAYTTLRDAAGNERGANIDASNRLTVAPSLVSGSVASGAFASGALASGSIAAGAQVDLLTMRGTKNAGTAAANSILAGSVYNSTPLTVTDGQGVSLQGDANGFLKVNVTNTNANGSATSANSSPVVIASDQAAVAVKAASGAFASGSMAAGSAVDFLTTRQTVAAGTVAANSQLIGGIYNSTPITMSNGQGAALQLDANGYVKVNVATGGGSGGTSSSIGSAYPSTATAIGMRSGANMVAASQANASVPISGNSAATTQLVALSASAVIHVTSFDFMSAGSANVTLVYGTGTNCGTGTTALTGAYPLTAQAGVSKGSGQGPVLVVPAGNALCWTNSAGVQVSGSVSYTQFVP